MSSKNLYEEDSSMNNTSVNKKKKAKHVNNRFSISKPSFLKKSTISSILNTFNDGNYSHRVAIDKIHTSKNSIDASLSIDRRRNKKLSKIFTNKKNAQTQMKRTITSNFYKNKNMNKENISLNNYKVNLTMKNHINLNNTSNSFIRNISKSKSINKDTDSEKYGGKDIGTSSASPIEIVGKKNRINSYKTKNKENIKDKDKEKLKYIFFKSKAKVPNKQYIYVQKNIPLVQHDNNNNKANYNNNNKYDFKTLKTERLSERYKRINLNNKNKTERIIVPKNKLKNSIGSKINDNANTSKKKFTFNDLKALNELINKKGSKEKEKQKEKENNINNINMTNNKKTKINLSNLLKNILSDNSSYNSTNYKTKINKTLNYTKSKDSKSSHDYSNEKNNNKTQDMADNPSSNILISPRLITVKSRKNNSVKRRSPANTKDIISKILNDNKSQEKEKSFDANNSFQKTARNFLHSKRESFIVNKNNKKPTGYINLLIIDSNEKRKLYAQAKNQKYEKFHKSLTDRSKLIDYINFKVGSNQKQKENKKENIINITNKPHKKENLSRNIKNSNNFTNSNSITNENNNTNYISPKQYEKEDKTLMHSTTPLIYNKMISMTLNKSLKMTSNNSNLNMSIKNNNNNNNSNNGKLIQQKLKNNKINKKIIHKKKILHDKKASMTNPSTFDCKKNGLIYDKKNALDKAFSPRFNLTSRAKDNSLLKKEICPIQINKKVIKIDSCSVPGYSAPGVSKINQDNYFIIKEFMNNTEQFFMGICDGHGSYGHLISEYICNILPPKIKIISNENIKKAFLSTNKSLIEESKIDCSLSGSTCSSLIISQNKLISANVGDSRAVLARYENGQYNAINLTRDHKPTEPDEMKRILNNGGRIKQFTEPRTGNSIGPERIWLKNSEIPGLAMSRSLGDNLAHTVGVSAEPEIQKFEFNGSEKFILLASDGIWEFIDSDESVRIIKDFYEKDMDAVGALSALVKEAFKRWKSEEDNIDDITAILIFFE